MMLKYKEFINKVLGSNSLNESISKAKLQKVIVDSSFGNLDIASDKDRVKNTKNISIDDFDSLIKKTLGVLSTCRGIAVQRHCTLRSRWRCCRAPKCRHRTTGSRCDFRSSSCLAGERPLLSSHRDTTHASQAFRSTA